MNMQKRISIHLNAVLTVWLITTALSGGALTASASELDSKRSTLVQVKQQIEKTSGALQQKQQAEQSAVKQLSKLEQAIASSNNKLRQQQQQLEQARRNINELQQRIQRYQAILARSQKDVEKRLKALYTSGDICSLKLIFSTETPLELTENVQFLSIIASHDRQLLHSYREQMARLGSVRKELQQQLEQKEALLQKQKQKKEQLLRNKHQRRQLVAKIRSDAKRLKKTLRLLKERSQKLQALVQRLHQQRKATFVADGTPFISLQGKLPWPSSGAIRRDFGTGSDSRTGSIIKRNGVEIVAVPGTNIRAIAAGRVAFAAPFKGFGNLIIIDHGAKYFSLYAQVAYLDKPVGTIVKQGEVISTSGYEGKDSYYFELRHSGTPLNPHDWLQKRP